MWNESYIISFNCSSSSKILICFYRRSSFRVDSLRRSAYLFAEQKRVANWEWLGTKRLHGNTISSLRTDRKRKRERDDKSGEWETIHFLSGHGPHTTSLYTSRTLIFCLWRVYTHAERIGYFSCMSSHMLLLHTDAYKHKEPLSSSCCCRRRRFAILQLAWSSRFDSQRFRPVD